MSYRGFQVLDFSVASWLLRGCLVLLPLFLLVKPCDRLSKSILWMLYVITYIPIQLFVGHISEFEFGDPLLCRLIVAFSFCLSNALVEVDSKRRRNEPRLQYDFKLSPNRYTNLLWVIVCLVYGCIFLTFGFRFRFIGIDDVYLVRGNFSEQAAHSSSLGSYCIAWASKVINPFLTFLGMRSRRRFLVIVGVVGQLMVFSIAAFKDALAALVLTFGLWAVQRFGLNKQFHKVTLIGCTVVFLGCYLLDIWLDAPLPIYTVVITRRVALIPPLLTSYYFDFFSEHETYALAHSVFKLFLNSPYELRPAYMLGGEYALSSESSLNANYLADGMANFRWFGVILVSVLLAFLLRILDLAMASSATRKVGIFLIIPFFSLTNSAFATSLMTHGIFLAIALLVLMPTEFVEGEPASRRGGSGGSWPRVRGGFFGR